MGMIHSLCKMDPYYRALNKFDRYYHIDLYQVIENHWSDSPFTITEYKSLGLDSVCRAIIGEGKLENLDGLKIQSLCKSSWNMSLRMPD